MDSGTVDLRPGAWSEPGRGGVNPEEVDFPIAATAQSRLGILDMSQASPWGKLAPSSSVVVRSPGGRGGRGATRCPSRRDGPESSWRLDHESGLSAGEDRALFERRREVAESRTRLSLWATPVEGRERALLR